MGVVVVIVVVVVNATVAFASSAIPAGDIFARSAAFLCPAGEQRCRHTQDHANIRSSLFQLCSSDVPAAFQVCSNFVTAVFRLYTAC